LAGGVPQNHCSYPADAVRRQSIISVLPADDDKDGAVSQLHITLASLQDIAAHFGVDPVPSSNGLLR
jgi:hypothetical protein